MRWKKRLSRTDAQIKTKGYPVAYLRFTQGDNPVDVWTWFREKFFGTERWTPGTFGKAAVEIAHVPFAVSVLGRSLGRVTMMVTHDESRRKNHKTPTTYLHYAPMLLREFAANDLSKMLVVVEKIGGVYSLTIQAAAPPVTRKASAP